MHYVTFWKNLQAVSGIEKLAESDDLRTATQAQPLLAGTCDAVFADVKQAAASPAELAGLMLSMRDAHRITGEKCATSPELAAELLQKLVTAAYVDDVLTEKLSHLSGEEHASARAVQLLGREYALTLMRGLLA